MAGELSITDRFRPRTAREFVARVVREVLEFGGESARDVSLLLTDDAEIARVHGEFLGDPTPTDVITFELDDTIELVVNVERARTEARRMGHTIRAELALYIVHGVLHACGYDDHDVVDRAKMRRAERDVLERLGQRYTAVDEDV